MSLTWPAVQALARGKDEAGVIRLLSRATPAERRAAAPAIESGVRALTGAPAPAERTAYALAVVGVAPSAARAFTLLRRPALSGCAGEQAPHFVALAEALRIPWIGDLGVRLARRLPPRDPSPDDWEFAAALMRAGDTAPPVTEAVTRGWVRALARARRTDVPTRTLAARMRADPWRDLLLPAVFEIDTLGADVGAAGDGFPAAVAELVRDGTLERKTILDAVIDRLRRGGRWPGLRPFVLLHDALEPTVDELSTHALDYAALLDTAPDPVAALARRAVRTVDDAGRLDRDTLRTAGVRALPHTGSDAPSRPVPVAAMPPPVADADELAAEVSALVHDPTAIGWERVLAGLVALYAADERHALAATLLPVIGRYPGWFHPTSWNAGSPFLALGTAIRSATGDPRARDPLRQLAAAVRVARQQGRRGHPHSPFDARPTGVLALRAAEVAVHLTGSMVPMTVATPTHVNGSVDAGVLLERLLRAEAEGWQPWPFDFEQALLRMPRAAGHGSAHPAAGEPVAGEPVAVRAGRLVSPTGRQFARWLATGGLPDPISEPFTQPGGRPHPTSEPFTQPGGRPDPTSATPTRPGGRGRDGGGARNSPAPRRVVATLRPARDGGLRLERQLLTLTPPDRPVHVPDQPDGAEDVLAMVLPHHREVAAAWALADVAALADQNRRDTGRRLLPLLAAGGGPVGPAMAYALAYALAAGHEPDRAAAADALAVLAAGSPVNAPAVLPAGSPANALATSDAGPAASVVAVIDASRAIPAGAADDASRAIPAGAADGVSRTIPAGAADGVSRTIPAGAAVGAALADLGGDGTVKLTRVVPALAGLHGAGASALVWELLVAALPPLLTTTVRGLADLLELAAQVAAELGVTGEVLPGLAEVAGRPDNRRVVREARRLRSVLGS